MNETLGILAKLQTLIEAGQRRFESDRKLELGYVTGIVLPTLRDALDQLILDIDRSHHVNLEADSSSTFMIHYTSVGSLMSLLLNAANGHRSFLRLYDSAHFNDPDEGNYLGRNLPDGLDWAVGGTQSHAYVASFIDPGHDEERDMTDNLVFWRTYGREGEGCSLKVRVPASNLRRVLYGSGDARTAGSKLLPVLKLLEPLLDISNDIHRVIIDAIWESLERIQYLYKSGAYSYEAEYRFVLGKLEIDEDRVCIDISDPGESVSRVRHYCEHEDLEIGNIFASGSSVTLGPCVPNSDDLCGVLGILRSRIITHRIECRASSGFYFDIKKSKIPYRKS